MIFRGSGDDIAVVTDIDEVSALVVSVFPKIVPADGSTFDHPRRAAPCRRRIPRNGCLWRPTARPLLYAIAPTRPRCDHSPRYRPFRSSAARGRCLDRPHTELIRHRRPTRAARGTVPVRFRVRPIHGSASRLCGHPRPAICRIRLSGTVRPPDRKMMSVVPHAHR